MSAQYALRPLEWCDLPTLKRWRALPEVQRHLRHPHTTWFQHLRWFLRRDPTRKVWAVTWDESLVGIVGLYYRMGHGAEVSVLVMDGDREDYPAEKIAVHLLTQEARAWGLTSLWAEVLVTAPLQRHSLFPHPSIWADTYSTLYRWNL